jgi:hypothetical protein
MAKKQFKDSWRGYAVLIQQPDGSGAHFALGGNGWYVSGSYKSAVEFKRELAKHLPKRIKLKVVKAVQTMAVLAAGGGRES